MTDLTKTVNSPVPEDANAMPTPAPKFARALAARNARLIREVQARAAVVDAALAISDDDWTALWFEIGGDPYHRGQVRACANAVRSLRALTPPTPTPDTDR